MGETTNMHFVPRTYLKRFSYETIKAGSKEFYIHAVEKVRMKRAPEPRNVKRICKEENLYLLPGETEEQRQLLENMYRIIFENDYDKIYNILIDEDRDTLTQEERYDVVSFVVSMFYRNNSWHIFHNRVMNDILEHAYTASKFNNHNTFYFEEREISIAGKSLEELQREHKEENRPLIATVTAELIFKLTRLRMVNDFVSVIKASDGFEFITSDNPVSFHSKTMPFDPTNSLWMPIDNKHILQLQPWADQLQGMTIGRMNESPVPGLITTMSNDYQARQSNQFLLGTMTALRKYQINPEGVLKGKMNKIVS